MILLWLLLLLLLMMILCLCIHLFGFLPVLAFNSLSLSSRYSNFICMHHQLKDDSSRIIVILIVNVLFFTCYLLLAVNLLLTPTNHSRFGFCILFVIVSVLVRYLFDLFCFIIFFVKLLILCKDIIQNNAILTCNCTC